MLKDWLLSVFGPTSRFAIGDSVQPAAGDRELMVVTKVVLGQSKEPLLLCHWVDTRTQEKRERLFPESEVVPFDWNRPMDSERQVYYAQPEPAKYNYQSFSGLRDERWENLMAEGGMDVQGAIGRLNGNKDLYKRLLLKFAGNNHGFTEKLQSVTANGEWEEAHRMLHTLKGLAGTLGMTSLQVLCRGLESAASGHGTDELQKQLPQLSRELSLILESISKNVQPYGATQVLRSPSEAITSLADLEQSILAHSPQAQSQLNQMGNISGYETQVAQLGNAISSYQFETALQVLHEIRNQIDEGTHSGMKGQ